MGKNFPICHGQQSISLGGKVNPPGAAVGLRWSAWLVGRVSVFGYASLAVLFRPHGVHGFGGRPFGPRPF
ncbi:hypothetical protein Y045_6033 [Burkholderia pseudomallei MSHR2451]|nr:hypothetical protein Y045_6033 [Burkholderia pseudomallei MSHR2451]